VVYEMSSQGKEGEVGKQGIKEGEGNVGVVSKGEGETKRCKM
jgi:hypothetical protein